MDWFFDRVYRARAFDPRFGWWISLGVMILHLWFAYTAKDGSWISAGGAVVIVIGVLTIARGLIRTGDEKVKLAGRTILRQVQEVDGQVVLADPEGEHQRYQDADAEFRHGPAIVIVGTLINGYGGLIANPLLCAGCMFG